MEITELIFPARLIQDVDAVRPAVEHCLQGLLNRARTMHYAPATPTHSYAQLRRCIPLRCLEPTAVHLETINGHV